MDTAMVDEEHTWITVVYGTECYATIIEQRTLVPEPTTHKPVALGETLQLVIGPQLGGTYQKQTDAEDEEQLTEAERRLVEVPPISLRAENLANDIPCR